MAIDAILSALAGLPHGLIIVVMSALPIVELRGSIPVALGLFHLPIWQTALYAVIGSMIPAPIILLGWQAVVGIAEKHWPWLHRMLEKHHEHLQNRWQGRIQRYGLIGLTVFAAIPLPLFGVWTGALVAWIFGLRFRAAMLALLAGTVIAAAIVTILTISSLRIF